MRLYFADFIPKAKEPVNFAPDIKPNLTSVVVHVDFGDDAILLGSDLETHDNGWNGVLQDIWCTTKRTKSSAYKVAHHGSITGEHPEIWQSLLTAAPYAVMTPFVNGGVALPTDADRTRIKGNAKASFISSNATRKPAMDAQLEKRLSAMCTTINRVNSAFGCVRLRKKITLPNGKSNYLVMQLAFESKVLCCIQLTS